MGVLVIYRKTKYTGETEDVLGYLVNSGDGDSTQQRIRMFSKISQPTAQQLTFCSAFVLGDFFVFCFAISPLSQFTVLQ